MRRVDPKVIERWFAIRPMLWAGRMVTPGDQLDPGACDMAGKVIAGEVLGCKAGQHIAINRSNGRWEVVSEPVAKSTPEPPTVTSTQAPDPVPMPEQEPEPAPVVESGQQPASVHSDESEPEPEQDLAPVESLFGTKPKRKAKKKVLKGRTKKATT